MLNALTDWQFWVCLILWLNSLTWLYANRKGNAQSLGIFGSSKSTNTTINETTQIFDTTNVNAQIDQDVSDGGVSVNVLGKNNSLGEIRSYFAPVNLALGDEAVEEQQRTLRAEASEISEDGIKGGLFSALQIDMTTGILILVFLGVLLWRVIK